MSFERTCRNVPGERLQGPETSFQQVPSRRSVVFSRAQSGRLRAPSPRPRRELFVQSPCDPVSPVFWVDADSFHPSVRSSLQVSMGNADGSSIDRCYQQFPVSFFHPIVPDLWNVIATTPGVHTEL